MDGEMIQAVVFATVTLITWIIISTSMFVRLRSKVAEIEAKQMECSKFRVLNEDTMLNANHKIERRLEVLQNDISWIKKSLQRNGTPPKEKR